jgi:hypothetical protein
MHDIAIWLLVITLIFPRIGLLIAWFSHQIPANNIPFIGDAFLAVFLPRLLMVIYIAGCMGTGNGWFWAHLIGFILAALFNIGRTMQVMEKGKNPWDYKSYMPGN